MIDLRRLRADPEGVKAAIARRGEDVTPLDRVVELDERQRQLGVERDAVRNEVKGISRQVGDLHKEGRGDEAAELQDRSRDLGDRADALADAGEALGSEIREGLLRVPNTPSPDCPDGLTPEENPVVRQVGADPDSFPGHQRVPHWEIGEELGILDVATGTKLSGAMFVMYSGLGATLCRALCQYGLDRNADAYREMRPPTLVRTETMVSTGHLPKFEDDAYHLERDDLWAIPTAEVPLTSLFRDEVLDEDDLPLKLMAHTSCFRREAGSAGRATRGLLRVDGDLVGMVSLRDVLSARIARSRGVDLGGPCHPGPVAGPRVRQGRVAGLCHRGAVARGPHGHPRPGRGGDRRPGPHLPGHRPGRRRPRRLVGPYLRHRGVCPRS